MATTGFGTLVAGIANIANLKCCCGICNACPPGQDLPTSFNVTLSIASGGSGFSFARFNTTNTVTYNASHTGKFGTAYAGWFFTAGTDDGAHDYTEISIKCAGTAGLEIEAYRFLVSPPSSDSLNLAVVRTGISSTSSSSYDCSPLYMYSTSPVFFLSDAVSGGAYGDVRSANSITIAP